MGCTFTKRAISPLQFEPAPYAPEDVICPGSEEEDSSEEHRWKKRRRVEIAGKQYLDGRALLIQTAILRGPLDTGWVNPWADRKNAYAREDLSRYSRVRGDAGAKGPQKLLTEEPVTVKRRSVENDVPNRIGKTAVEAAEAAEPSTKRRRHDAFPDAVDPLKSKSNNTGHIKKFRSDDWLRRTNLGHQARSNKHKSPTPTPAPTGRSRPTYRPSPNGNLQPKIVPAVYWRPQADEAFAQHPPSGFTPINTRSPPRELPYSIPNPSKPAEPIPISGPEICRGEVDFPHISSSVRKSYWAAKQLSREAVRSTDKADNDLEVRRLSQEAASKAIENVSNVEGLGFHHDVSKPLVTEETSNSKKRLASRKTAESLRYAPPVSTTLSETDCYFARKSSFVSPRGKKGFVQASKLAAESLVDNGSASERRMSLHHGITNKVSPPTAADDPCARPSASSQEKPKLSFTKPGVTKTTRLQSFSPSGSGEPIGDDPFLKHSTQATNTLSPSHEEKSGTAKTSSRSLEKALTNGDRSKNSSSVLPEAQFIPAVAPLAGQVVSGSSTNLLETEKQSPKLPSYREVDVNNNLSTQPAVLKSQCSFKDKGLTNLNSTFPSLPGEKGSPVKPVQPNGATHRTTKTEGIHGKESTDTRTMTDENAPFVTTITKKRPPSLRKRASFAPSHTNSKLPLPAPSPPASAPFPTYSPTMSTSPDTSPPPKLSPVSHAHRNSKRKTPVSSTLTSFSILPNGTLTETSLLQDGQQPYHFPHGESYSSLPNLDFGIPLSSGSGGGGGANTNGSGGNQNSQRDLEAAIEEAGSFLGEWDVDSEARKVGASAIHESLGRSILSRRKARA